MQHLTENFIKVLGVLPFFPLNKYHLEDTIILADILDAGP